jgi:hypothetical protein
MIQSHPDLAGNTTLIAIPECGRNLLPNSILDENQWAAFDHSDENALRIFSLMAGPAIPGNLTLGGEGNPIGQVTNAMLTVADILGVKNEVVSAGNLQSGTQSFLDLI